MYLLTFSHLGCLLVHSLQVSHLLTPTHPHPPRPTPHPTQTHTSPHPDPHPHPPTQTLTHPLPPPHTPPTATPTHPHPHPPSTHTYTYSPRTTHTCSHVCLGLLFHLWRLLVHSLQVSEHVDVGHEVNHVLFTTTIWHADQRAKVIQGRTHQISYKTEKEK